MNLFVQFARHDHQRQQREQIFRCDPDFHKIFCAASVLSTALIYNA
jgi:hypothetical protein